MRVAAARLSAVDAANPRLLTGGADGELAQLSGQDWQWGREVDAQLERAELSEMGDGIERLSKLCCIDRQCGRCGRPIRACSVWLNP